jgi:CBS domain-containing protein
VVMVWTALIASFIWFGAGQAVRAARMRERLPFLQTRTLTRRALPVVGDLPLGEGLRRAAEAGARALVVVDGAGTPVGLVSEAAVVATPEDRRPWVPVSSVARRLEPALVLSADLRGEDLLKALQASPATEYLVLDPTGAVYGVLSTSDVERAFAASG